MTDHSACVYETHRASDWRLSPDHPIVCGVCHPKPANFVLPAVVDRDQAPPLTPDAARFLTEEVKADAVALWAKLRALYEGKAHIALGYASWGRYFEEEFGRSGNYGYRLLKSAEVMEQLPMGNSRPASERVARELVPLLSEPDGVLEEVWGEVIARHDEPTAEQTAAVVSASVSVNGHKPKRATRERAIDPPTAFPAVLAVVVLGRDPRILAWLPLPLPQADGLEDLDLEHARRALAEQEEDLRKAAGPPPHACRCARPISDGEGGCTKCCREIGQ